MTHDAWMELIGNLVEENFPKGECKERGHALVLVAELTLKLKDLGVVSST